MRLDTFIIGWGLLMITMITVSLITMESKKPYHTDRFEGQCRPVMVNYDLKWVVCVEDGKLILSDNAEDDFFHLGF